MTHIAQGHVRHCQALVAGAALLLVQAALAAPGDKPALPASVNVAQQQHARWVAAFNGWRGAKRTWPQESDAEAEMRRETRLLILPTPAPQLSRQRWLDGRAIVMSSGLVTLLDELLLAEAASGKACLEAYGNRVLLAVNGNRRGLNAKASEPPVAWPRLTALAEAGKAGRIGQTYDAAGRKEKPGPCQSVTPALLHSSAIRTRVADGADALALWLFTRQNLLLAHPPAIEAPKPDQAAKPCVASPAPAAKMDNAPPRNHELVVKQPSTAQMHVQVQVQVDPSATGCKPAPAASDTEKSLKDLKARPREALATTGRSELQTVAWLQKHMPFFDAGTSPPVNPSAKP